MEEVLGLALSTMQSMGILPYVTAMLVIALVGGFISVIFRRD